MFLRNHDELTLEMVTDEERDYMYRVYATDPHARINLGIRRRLAPLLANSRRKIELLNTLLFSMPVRRSSITGTRLVWETISISAIATVVAPQCSGARTVMRDFQDRIHSNFICRLPSIRNIITKRLTSRTSRKTSPRCSGGCAGSLRCGKILRRFRAALLNFSIPITRRFWHFFVASRRRPSLSW